MLFIFQTILICVLFVSGIGIGVRLAEYIGWGGWVLPPFLGFCTVFVLTWPIGKLLKLYACVPSPSSHNCNSRKCVYSHLFKDDIFDLWRCDNCQKTVVVLCKTESFEDFSLKKGEWFIVLDLKNNPTNVVQCRLSCFSLKRKENICSDPKITEPLTQYFLSSTVLDRLANYSCDRERQGGEETGG